MRDGAVAFDGSPRAFLEFSPETPGAKLFALAGITPPPVSVKDARATLGSGPGTGHVSGAGT